MIETRHVRQGFAMFKRYSVVTFGLVLGAFFSFVVAITMPFIDNTAGRVEVWTGMMSGPLFGSRFGMGEHFPEIYLGWLGLLLIPAHPARPHPVTAVLTLIGLALWFYSGWLGVMHAVCGG